MSRFHTTVGIVWWFAKEFVMCTQKSPELYAKEPYMVLCKTQREMLASSTSANSTVCAWHTGTSERWGAGVEYHFQEFNEPYAPS